MTANIPFSPGLEVGKPLVIQAKDGSVDRVLIVTASSPLEFDARPATDTERAEALRSLVEETAQTLASEVQSATDALNAAIRKAQDAGLAVEIDTIRQNEVASGRDPGLLVIAKVSQPL